MFMMPLCHLSLANWSTPQRLWIVPRFFTAQIVFSSDRTEQICSCFPAFLITHFHLLERALYLAKVLGTIQPSPFYFQFLSSTDRKNHIFSKFFYSTGPSGLEHTGFIILVTCRTCWSVNRESSLNILYFILISNQLRTCNTIKSVGLLTHPRF